MGPLGAILGLSWGHLGASWGFKNRHFARGLLQKLASRSRRPKKNERCGQKKPVKNASKIGFGPKWPQEAPRGPKMAPRWPQEAPRWPQEWPKRGPRRPQGGPKTPPRSTFCLLLRAGPPRTLQKAHQTHLGPLLDAPRRPTGTHQRPPRRLRGLPRARPRAQEHGAAVDRRRRLQSAAPCLKHGAGRLKCILRLIKPIPRAPRPQYMLYYDIHDL